MKKILFVILAIGFLFWNVTPTVAAQKIVFKIAQDSSTEHPYQRGCEKFKEIIEAETNGAVEVQIFPNAQLGSEAQVMEGIKLNTLDATVSSTGAMAAFVPEVELFNLPFIFRDMSHFYKVVDGPIGQRIAKAIEEKLNSVFLGWWTFGSRNAWNKVRPVLKPDDFKGLKIRVMGSPIMLDTFNAFGAQATTLSWGELYTALQQGVVDGAECDPVDLLVEKFYEVTKYVSMTNHFIGAAPFFFSKKRYDKLSPYFQTLIVKAGRASVIAEREAQESLVDKAMAELKQKGIKFYDVDTNPFKQKAKMVHKKNADKVGGMELIEMIAMQ